MSEVVTVSGTPTLSLNDGDTATYVSGSGTSTLSFSYTVSSGDSNVAALAITEVNLPNGATITDSNGNAADLAKAATTFSGLQIETTGPTVTSVAESPPSGGLNIGNTVSLTLDLNQVVTVNTTGGTPTLTLNDGGTATYQSGSGSSALVFSYTVAAGQSTTSLAATAVNLNGATVTDGAGYTANLSLSGLTQTGPRVSTLTASSLAIDGNGFYTTSSWSTSDTVTLSTTYVNDVIILDVSENGTTAASVSDTAGLTWQLKAVAGNSSNDNLIYQYYAISPNALSADVITVNYAGGATSAELNAFGIAGANTSSPFDTNASIPATANSGTASATTSNSKDLIFAVYRFSSDASPSAGSSWTAINASGDYYLSEYKVVSATQAGLVATASTTDQNGGIVDAVVAATVATGPVVSSLVETPSSGDLDAGKTVTYTLTMSEVVTVNTTGGSPTLSLNDGGTATYVSGSGSSALTFSYTVLAGQNTPDLVVSAVDLNGAAIQDGSGNSANLSLTGITQGSPEIDTTAPTVSSVTGTAGDYDAGKVLTLTLNMSEAVNVTGMPTLTLNDGGSASYVSGSGSSALVFSYTVGAGQNIAALAVTGVTGTIADLAGNALSTAGLPETFTGVVVDTTTPTISAIAESPSSGDLNAGKTVTFTLTTTEAVTVNTTGGTPTLTLNDGSTATYSGGSGTTALTFSYTVGAGQNIAALAASAVNLNGGTIQDGAGNAASLSLTGLTQTGPQIDTTTPTISSLVESPSSGDLDAGKTVTLTLDTSEVVTVTGTPTLTLNDGGTATYTGGSGTSALTFSYTVGAGQNIAALAATAVNLNGGTIKDGAGNAASLSLTGLTQTGPQIDTTLPTVSSVTATAGDYDAGKVLTLTLNMSEAVNVTGMPTLTLNDGGSASYVSGSGSSALVFSYTVGAGQNIAALAVTGVTGTIADLAGNALSTAGLPETFTGVVVDTTTPTISAIAESPSSGDLNAGKTVTFTLTTTEAVTVNTTGGTPTLTLNDGSTATYSGGSGTTALTFSYTVGAGQNTAALAATAVNLNGGTIQDGAGNAASLSLTGLTQTGPQIDTATPTISSLVESPSSGDLDAGKTVTLTLDTSEVVTVTGTPTLTLNDGGTATYTGGSGTSALTFSYTVGAGQNIAALAATAVNLNGGTIKDGAGNAASLSLTGLTQTGPKIDTTLPTVSSVTATAGDYGTGQVLTLTLNMSEAVNVTGTPTLTLSDGGTASYVSGSGSNALVFSYTVAAGQNTAALQATTVTGTITDLAGNALSSSSLPETLAGVIVDTTGPTISSLVESPSSGDLDAGKTVTLTLDTSEVVTVNTTGGTPTLTLNDGGTATYMGGSGTNALTFSYTVGASQNTAALAATAVNLNGATIKDGASNPASLSLTGLTQTGPKIDTTAPTVSSVTATAGDYDSGKVLTLTLNMSEAVNVTGTPTLTLNDGGSASYVSGSGSSALVFSYTVGAGQNAAALQVTGVTGAIADLAGNALSTFGLPETFTGVVVDTTTPTISAIAESPSSGDLNAGKTVTFTLTTTEAVTVNTTGGTPTLTLNDGSTATYSGGSGTTALTFSYTVGAGQNTAALAATAVNLNGGTIQDGAGNAASLSLTGLTQTGPQIDTATPTISSLVESPSSGDLDAGKTVTLTLDTSEVVTVTGTPTLTLNDGGTATYTGGSGTSALTFSYTVGAGQNIAALAATAVNLNGGTIKDGAGNAASLSLTGLTQTGPKIDTTLPTVSSVTATAGDYGTGQVLTLTLNMSEAVNVTGTPTLTLNDGGTASYVSGSGSSALVFSYTVALGQNTAALAVTGVAGTITDLAGNALSTSGLPETFTGVSVITTPTISSIAESPSSGDFDAGKTVTLTLNLSEAATVNTTGGTPTLTLNDGGTATYSGGSGTTSLTFSYTVGAGQNTAALAATAVNLNGGTIQDGSGNAASLALTGLTQTGPQIDTVTPTISSLVENPSSGDLGVGKTITYTLGMSEAVTVNTAGGSPTLSLNDGGTATYVSGSGTNALTFSYTVLAGQNVPDLIISAVNLNGSTVQDGAGNAANLSITGVSQGSPQIDTTTPTISSLVESPSSGDLDAGKTVTLTLKMSEAVTVVGGAPTLTLNDGGTATYTGGSGTSALTFSYTVAAGQNTGALAATAVNLNGAAIKDGAGNAANFSLTGLTQSGPQIDTATPTAVAVTTAPASGDVQSGGTVTIAVKMSETVNVTGTPTLALNNGGSATYLSGSGSSTLVFSYTVGANQNTAALQLSGAVSGGSITDKAGNAAIIAPTNLNLQVNTDQWENPTSANWGTTTDWSSPAGVPTSSDVAMLDAAGTFQVTSTANETIFELNTVSTATLAIARGTAFTVTNGTGAGVQAGVVSAKAGATLNISGVFDNTGTIWAQGGTVNVNGALTGGVTAISGAGWVVMGQASSENISFSSGSTGGLVLGRARYSGWISGFGSNTTQSIDLAKLKFAGARLVSYNPNSTDTAGILTVSNGKTSVALQFTGTYTLADFHIANDGAGGTLLTDPPAAPGAVNNAPVSISNGEVLAIRNPHSGDVTFAGRTGTLWLDHPSSFTGTVSDFGAKTEIDLPTMAFDSETTVGYSPKRNGTGGTLSVSDGVQRAQIALLGQYTAASFGLASDHHGGTMVVFEPPHSANQSLLSTPRHG